jgi:hypothetical protein
MSVQASPMGCSCRRIQLLDHPKLTNQLCGLERRTARGGRDSIDHAPGAHDDLCNAVAGAASVCVATGLTISKRSPLDDPIDIEKGTCHETGFRLR